MTKSRGILMSEPMIRAYLAGRKSQTRRTRGLEGVNKNPNEWEFKGSSSDGILNYFVHKTNSSLHFNARLPYGWIGDSLYFKETYAPMCRVADGFCYEGEIDPEHIKKHHYIEYRADTGNPYPGEWPADEAKGNDEAPKWKSSLYMPRASARIEVPILSVRVERLKDITDQDAINEGVENRDRYFELWDRLNGAKYPANLNPWVWVYEFQRKES